MSMTAPSSDASAASTDGETFGPIARAAIWRATFDVHCGLHKPLLTVDAAVVDPLNRDGVFATEDDICGCGDDVAVACFSDKFTTGICVQLSDSEAAREKKTHVQNE